MNKVLTKYIFLATVLLISSAAIAQRNEDPGQGQPQQDHRVIVGGDIFGGGNKAPVKGSSSVMIRQKGNRVGGDVYGGGALADVNVTAEVSGGTTTYYHTPNTTTQVDILEGTIVGDVYGGGLGNADTAALVYGEVTVNIGAGTVDQTTGFATTVSGNATFRGSNFGGNVFGCNNINGTPLDNVFVNIFKTAHNDLDTVTNFAAHQYAIDSVFGGGNKADYLPSAAGKMTTVHVYTCNNTIQKVYGGGNAADLGDENIGASDTIIIDGGRFDWVFGGGNGAGNHDDPGSPNYNPGANIFGDVAVTFHAGDVNYFFGGSNEKGNISGTKNIYILNDVATCIEGQEENHIGELYSGNNKAEIEGGGTRLVMPCRGNDPCQIDYIFGGSRDADIHGDVVLTIEGGLYNNVFGGNNLGGTIYGNVTLNLYGGIINNAAFGGNKGGFDEYGAFHDGGSITGNITVNVEDHCICPLSVKDVFGAGDLAKYHPGTGAREFNPMVNVNHICLDNDNNIRTILGDVYGGGNGSLDSISQKPGMVKGNPKVTIGDLVENHIAAISGNVYGGGKAAKVEGNTTVLMQNANSQVRQDVYGGGKMADVFGTVEVEIVNGTVTQDVYGGGALADVNGSNGTATTGATTTVTLTGGTVRNIYGGGLGRKAEGSVSAVEAKVYGDVQVTVDGGTVIDVYGCNNLNGAPQNDVQVDINNNVTGNVFGGGNLAAASVSPIVNINNGTVGGSVFGGGNQAGVGGGNVNMIDGTVLGAGVTGGTGGIFGGCNTSGTVGGDIVVNVTGGTIGGTNRANIHGGGFGHQTATSGNVIVNYGTQSTTPSNTPTLTGDLYGGSALGNVGSTNGSTTTMVNVINGSITGDVYGGGLGSSDHAAAVNGNVMVYFGKVIENTLYNTAVLNTYTDGTSTLGGNVFGCNNIYGAPTGSVQVEFNGGTVTNVYGGGNLALAEVSPIVNINNGTVSGNVFGGGLGSTAKVLGQPSVTIGTESSSDGYQAIVSGDVYGGGDMADVKGKTTVLVQKCNTVINGDVYGGGNAAHILRTETNTLGTTDVTVTGGIITGTNHGMVFGGGHGDKDANPQVSADVAVSTNVTINGGTINQVYGGSNSMGSINGGNAGGINVLVNKASDACDLHINEVYGGGNYAASQAGSIDIECTGTGVNEGITYVYGGANRADVTGPIELTIDEGRIAYVFGGNNNSGSITNGITVNIEKKASPCVWEVGDVFGGGNLAIYGGTPVVNVKNGTVANVFGGGNGDPASTSQEPGQVGGTNVTIGDATEGYCAVVTGNVYGGGNAAKVAGNTIVTYNDGNTSSSVTKLFGGGNQAGVTGTTTVTLTNGTVNTGVYGGCNEKGNVANDITVNINGGTVGSQANLNGSNHITGDVFGGGYGGFVSETNPGTTTSGNVKVNINNGTIWGNVYGGSAFGDVNAAGKTTIVNIMGGTLETSIEQGTTAVGLPCNIYHGGNVFGGGLGQKAATGVTAFAAKVYGAVEVNIGTGTLVTTGQGSDYNLPTGLDGSAIIKGNVYGCNNQNGSPQDNVVVNVFQTAHPEATGGYALHDVFGGGNQADFTGGTATVNIYTCVNTIERTFSGGNAAATNSVRTMIQGGRIREVYGGGNGEVSAANVNGTVSLDIHGGEIGQSYAGSNQQGTITQGSQVHADDLGPCGGNTTVDEFFCGGNFANYIGDIDVIISCNGRMEVTNLYGGCNQALVLGNIRLSVYGGTYDTIYGGSKGRPDFSADVSGNITLNIFGGTVHNAIFGGSNINGNVKGKIVVNVEEIPTSECSLEISEADVYGGGNKADYNPTNSGTEDYPQINIRNATVKSVYGGGLKAEVEGNPQIRIKKGSRVLGNVYGGGNMGVVDGDPRVIINGKDTSENPTGL